MRGVCIKQLKNCVCVCVYITFHKTWLSHSMAVVKLQKLLSSAKRCVFESNEIYDTRKKKSCKHLYAVCVEMRVKKFLAAEINTT